MNNYFPLYINLDNKQVKIADFLRSKNEIASEQWQTDWLNFLVEWYNKKDYIKVCTSGSTGDPKSIKLSKFFVAESAKRTIDFFNLKPGDNILNCLPANFIAGKLMIVRALVGQLNLSVVDPKTDFSFLKDTSYHFSAMVTPQVEKLFDLSISWNIEKLLIGGSAIPKLMEKKLQSIKTLCYLSYGMTETATHIALRPLNNQLKKINYYQCLNGIKVSTDDKDNLCIHINGADEKIIKTNDIADIIDSKRFYIKGRSDNRIISGGLKFQIEELEVKLSKYLNVSYYITSNDHSSLDQQIVIVVEGVDTPELRAKINNACELGLTKFERPRKIYIVEKLTRTKNGKIKRIRVSN